MIFMNGKVHEFYLDLSTKGFPQLINDWLGVIVGLSLNSEKHKLPFNKNQFLHKLKDRKNWDLHGGVT